jgi:lysyl-tRNA synthetase, class II
MSIPDNQQYRDRVAKLDKWRALGVDPYGHRVDDILTVAAARAMYRGPAETPAEGADRARVAGRIVLLRDTGKLIFLTIQDSSGRVQIGLSKKMVEEAAAAAGTPALWEQAKLLELGDIAMFEGKVGHTRTGEITIWSDKLALMSKSLMPPPDKFHGLSDVELRYRQRYVDLWANPDSMDVFLARSKILESIRGFLKGRGFIEVETPMLQPSATGAAAKPFVTHHNSLGMDLYLRISPELYLKRLLVGGMEKVFDINRNFRNEGLSPRHNPEFTMMEIYQAYSDLAGMMELTETLIVRLAGERLAALKAAKGEQAPSNAPLHLQYGERIIDFTPPFARVSYGDLFAKHVGCSMFDDAAVRAKAAERHLANIAGKDRDVLVGELFEHHAEPELGTFDRPVFLYDYPAALCPLTRRKPGDSRIAERFELYVAGMEVANAYTELNDPAVQEQTFSSQLAGINEEDSMAKMDWDYINALRYGMPPAGGLGIGIDRLVMLLTNQTTIRDVILFPLLKEAAAPKTKEEAAASAEDKNSELYPRTGPLREMIRTIQSGVFREGLEEILKKAAELQNQYPPGTLNVTQGDAGDSHGNN